MNDKVLIVDDDAAQLAFLLDVVVRFFGVKPEEVLRASKIKDAIRLLENHADISVAIVDSYLEREPTHGPPDGLEILQQLTTEQGSQKRSPCYRILVSAKLRDRKQIRDETCFDEFVYLRYSDGYSPVSGLMDALAKARDPQPCYSTPGSDLRRKYEWIRRCFQGSAVHLNVSTIPVEDALQQFAAHLPLGGNAVIGRDLFRRVCDFHAHGIRH